MRGRAVGAVIATLVVGSVLCLPSAVLAQVPPRAGLRTVFVGPVPDDPLASGERLLDALATINPTSCPGDNWKLWIAPGLYDLGSASLVMKPCVDIEGAGERATMVTASGDTCAAATVIAASDTELRLLTIESANTFTTCALRASGARMRLAHVTLLATDATNSEALSADNSSSLSLEHVTITADGSFVARGIAARASSLTLTDVAIVASGGLAHVALEAVSSTLVVYHSRLLAAPGTFGGSAVGAAGGLARVAYSQLEGDLSTGIVCLGNYDAGLAPVTCP